MSLATLFVLMPMILGPVPAGALKAERRPPAEKPVLSTDGQAIVTDMLNRSHGGERVGPSEFERLIRSDGSKAYAWINYLAGELSRASGENSYALRVQMQRRYLKTHPNDAEALEGLGRSHLEGGDWIRAIVEFSRALELGEPSGALFYNRGFAAEKLGDNALAHRDASSALELDGKNRAAEALYKLTKDRVSKVRVNLATGKLQPPSETTPTRRGRPGQERSPRPAVPRESSAARQSAQLTLRAQRHLAVRDVEAAITAAERATRLNPRNSQAFNLLATAHERAGNHMAAAANASAALALHPTSVPALNTRSWAYSGMRSFRKALADAQRAVSIEPESAFSWATQGRALGGLGRRENMLSALKRSADLDARFGPLAARAARLPEDSDTELLFAGTLESAPAGRRRKGSRKRRMMVLIIASLSGGLLVALGLLHIVSPSFREGVTRSWRRLRRAAPSPPACAAQLKGCDLVRVIATGGMGVVYEGFDHRLGRRVAVKKMRGEIRSDPKERKRFLNEARTVARLEDPHIVQIHSVIDTGEDLYLVFEYAEGKTLREILSTRPQLSWSESLGVLRGICKALDYAHAQGVVHRDLKPSNVMVDRKGRAKVMDFGIARVLQEAITKTLVTNTVFGTPSYMAPEAEEGKIRKASDLYSAAVMLYEMATGRVPFKGSPGAMFRFKSEGTFTKPSELNPALPKELDPIMKRALNPDPKLRFKSAGEFWEMLSELAPRRDASS